MLGLVSMAVFGFYIWREGQNEIAQALGMSIEQTLGVWTREGKPVIHLGPGENCFDLERLLSHRDINSRHLEAVNSWLVKKSEVSI